MYGINVEDKEGLLYVSRDNIKEPDDIINIGNSGTTIRLFTGIASGLEGFYSVFTGDKSIRNRPMERVISPLKMMGANILSRKHNKNAPISVYGSKLLDFEYSSSVASAQVKSALIFASLLSRVELIYTEPYLSRDHTERILKYLDINIKRKENTIYMNDKDAIDRGLEDSFFVPGDISTAAFFIVASAILEGSELIVRDVLLNPTRSAFLEVLKNSGVNIEILNKKQVFGEDVGDVRVKGGRFIGFQIHKDLVPMLIDEIPILAVLSMFADGVSEVRGAKELRYKESDRIHSISENIKSIGGKIVEFDDGFMIEGNGGKEIKGGYVKGYNDHRIIMAFYIAGLKSKKGVNIDDISWIKISYPEFIKTIEEVIV